MNVGQLRVAFENLVDDTVDNSMLWVWLNEGTEEVAMRYGKITSIEISMKAGESYKLPEDYLYPALVKDSSGKEYLDYTINEVGEIEVQHDGDYKIYYHKAPDTLPQNDDSAEPDIPKLLHSPLIYYAASKFYDRESGGDEEESAMATKMLTTFEIMVNKRVKALKAGKRKDLAISF